MGVLRDIWRNIKGGRSDAETAADLVIGTLNPAEKAKRLAQLQNVLYSVELAAKFSKDLRIDAAAVFVRGLITELGG